MSLTNSQEYHVREQTLEKYSMGRLSKPQAKQLHRHLLLCRRCQTRLEQTDAFVKAIRSALAKPATWIHHTTEGVVHLQVTRLEQGGWSARLFNAHLKALRHFEAPEAAYSWLVASFAEMFPGHRCTSLCRVFGE
jgi:hypothetical protein